MKHVYVVVEDHSYDGYGGPWVAFTTREAAEAWTSETPTSDPGATWDVFKVELVDGWGLAPKIFPEN